MNFSQDILLYYLCELAGLVMVAGGIWLIYREKIYLDTTNHKVDVVAIEIPLFGRLKTNVPALGLFILGIVPLIYPLYKVNTEYTRIVQEIKSESYPVAVYAVVRQKELVTDGKFAISIPIVNSNDYEPEIIYVAGGRLADQEPITLSNQKHGIIELQRKSLQGKPSPSTPVQPAVLDPDSRFK